LTIDWAGGPGDSKEDVAWLDKQLANFFAENKPDEVAALSEKLQGEL
jgi:homoserine O-acetyltransferase